LQQCEADRQSRVAHTKEAIKHILAGHPSPSTAPWAARFVGYKKPTMAKNFGDRVLAE